MALDLLETFRDYQHIVLAAGAIWAYFRFKKLQDDAQKEAKKVVDERHEAAKSEIHAALANGIGDLIDKKNTEQDTRWTLALRSEFSAHELRESENLRKALEEGKRDSHQGCDRIVKAIEDHDRRLQHVEEKLNTRSKR